MLATFYTLAYHLFAFTYKGRQYKLPDEEFDLEDQADACDISLNQLRMEPGDCLQRNSMLVPNASKDSFAYPELIKGKPSLRLRMEGKVSATLFPCSSFPSAATGRRARMRVYGQGSRIYFRTPGRAAQELFLTLTCTGRYDCDGSFLLLDCFGPHCYGTDDGWSILWVHFAGRMTRELLRAAEEYPPCIPPGERSFAMRRAMEGLYGMFGPGGRPVDGDIHRMLTELVTPFLTPEPSRAEDDAGCMDRIAATLSAHLSEHIAVADLAAMAHMSVSQLGRVFKKEKGMPPHQYLLEARLNAARFYLASTDLPLSQVAELCGFTDASALTNAFRRRMGVTPRAYARQQRTSQGPETSCS